ncbi:phage tail protein [Delftia acidovorans]|uniref:Phage tail protein n=1 Tax=Delftia acidovorans TaxID=80866 RepID=A0AAJ2R6B3_DELAC|nr:phage tail protein [Delftia acidovorans]MDX4957938.1 phage tail protein [Delftia acidovorans]
MSMQSVLGLAGAAVGSFFGMPQLGFLAGSLVGGLLTPAQRSEGPRLDDLKVTVSTYGTGIPTVYGTQRVGGNVIWSPDKLIERSTTTSQGKGGGPKVTTYTYYIHMAVALSRGELTSIRKIWQDGELVYDMSTDAALESALASSASPVAKLKFYTGTETQLPDPFMEAWDGGPGSTPAYRGLAYVMLTDIECPGGRVPQFSFEVTTGDLVDQQRYGAWLTITRLSATPQNYTRIPTNGDPVTVFSRNDYIVPGTPYSAAAYRIYALGLDSLEIVGSIRPLARNGVPIFGLEDIRGDADIDAVCLIDYPVNTLEYSGYSAIILSDGETRYYSTGGIRPLGGMWCKRGERIAFAGGAAYSGGIALFDYGSANMKWSVSGIVVVLMTITSSYLYVVTDLGRLQAYDVLTGDLYADVPYTGNSNSRITTDDKDRAILSISSIGTTQLVHILAEDDTINLNVTHTTNFQIAGIGDVSAVNNRPYTYIGNAVGALQWNGASDFRVCIALLDRVDNTPVPVASIIVDQCKQAGIDDSSVDVSSIDDMVHGYVIASPATARANLDPLLMAYSLGAREEDGKLRFFRLADIASVADVSYVDLGTVEYGSEPGDPLPLARTQEAELPSRVSVSYVDPKFDYQTDTQHAFRQVTRSVFEQTVQLPIALSADQAASVAQRVMFDTWSNRDKRSAMVPRKYAAVSAGDGVTIEYPEGVRSLWRVVRATDTGVRCEWEVVPADTSIYEQTAPGSSGGPGGQQVAPLPSVTLLKILDIPILRDADNNAGIYTAGKGYTSSYLGYTLRAGVDAATLAEYGSVMSVSVIGSAQTVPVAAPPNMIDEASVLVVAVGNGELHTITRDALLRGTLNTFALGAAGRWEIARFQRAEELSAGQYRLTGLWRGMRGTEHAMASHAVGDAFVLLTGAGMLRPIMGLSDLGQTWIYRALSIGRQDESAIDLRYANTGEGLRPFAPASLRARASGSDLTLSWVRRTRLSENWLGGTVPLGEAAQAYEIEVETPSGAIANYTASASPVTVRAGVYEPVLTASDGGRDGKSAVVVGGYLYSIYTSSGDGGIRKRVAESLALVSQQLIGVGTGSSPRLVANGSNLYTSSQGSGTPGSVRRWDADLVQQAVVALPLAGDGQDMVIVGGVLWVACSYSGIIRGLDLTTLATVRDINLTAHHLTTDGASIWAVSRATDRGYRIDPSTGSITLQFGVGGFPIGCVISGGLLWSLSARDKELACYSLSDGMPQAFRLPAGDDQSTGQFGALSAAGDYVAVGTTLVQVVNASLLEKVGQVRLSTSPSVAPVATLLAPGRLVASSSDRATSYYDRTAFPPGSVVRVYQMSEAVGRGHPALVTL